MTEKRGEQSPDKQIPQVHEECLEDGFVECVSGEVFLHLY